MSSSNLLQFAPFSSAIDAGFWYELSKRKLDVYKLDDTAVNINAYYSNNGPTGLPPIANIDYAAFHEPESNYGFPFKATLRNTNTLKEFKSSDKKDLLQVIGSQLWETITNGSAIKDTSLLQPLLAYTFADLKKYHYYYWIAFPALTYPKVKRNEGTLKVSNYLSIQQLCVFNKCCEDMCSRDKAAFFLYLDGEHCAVAQLTDYDVIKDKGGKVALVFADPSSYDMHPGWPLRNLLALAAYHWGSREWDVICLRETVREGQRSFDNSIVITVQLEDTQPPTSCPDVVGWEKNKEKLTPRKVDMSATMDPVKLAESAVDLNLKLMRWRLDPQLPLEQIKSCRCLLIGAGTLGCNVARCLLGWGVRHVTLVDSGQVSFSNPVRQTLFNFSDCGQNKATAAAKALTAIFPGVKSDGKVLNVPMPGHSVPSQDVERVLSEVQQLETLVKEHDILFLLTDTRESRWLPTLLGAIHNKVVLTAALGFDTYLVMRHGQRDGASLGCYFCNDIVAPGNSTQDRTLDQQCTVTRPGLSYIAAALVVELMVTILQHPQQACASAEEELPHQIRGYLHRFQNTLLRSKAFDKCTACSNTVVEAYRKEGFEFLLKVFSDSNYLEEVTGLTELMANIDMEQVLVLSDDDDSV